MPFNEIEDYDFSQSDSNGQVNQKVRDILNYAVQKWNSQGERRTRIEKLYNSYNGVINQKEIDSITKTYGKKSKTKYVKYRLGRSKLKQLHGEFLEIPINATVTTTNRDAQNEKMSKYQGLLGMSIAKPQIEKARELGYDVFSGINIPDRKDKSFWNSNNFKMANEIVMQDIVDDKLLNEDLKAEFFMNWIDLTIAAEIFGKVEQTIDGIDRYRYIPTKYALYDELVFDPFLERSPYLGEIRKLYYHELISNPEFKIKDKDRKRLKDMSDSWSSRSDTQGSMENIDGHPAFTVATIQWKGLEKVYKKISPAKGSKVPYKLILSQEYYDDNKSKIQADVKAGRYEVETTYREVTWTASRIAEDIFVPATVNQNIIQILNDNGKFTAHFDYCGMLFSTVNGFRVSLQEIIYELEKIYDDIRFQINKELKKIKGTGLLYDTAFLPKGLKTVNDVLAQLDEDGLIQYNSSAEGNRSGMEAGSDKVGIKGLTFGESNNLIILLNHALDIERVLDRITGMNDNRQGLTKATMTATANTNNIEASRSMTYDLFYFMTDYIERVMKKLCEKTKLNICWKGEDARKFVLGEDQIQYLVATNRLIYDNYAVTLTDGKKEKDILSKLEQWFPQEINAGALRTSDAAKFLMESSFSKAIRILDSARAEIELMNQQTEKVKQQALQEQTASQERIATANREDMQAHEIELKEMDVAGKANLKAIEIGGKGIQDHQAETMKAMADASNINKQDLSGKQ